MLVRLLQLASPTLPIGAFSYSSGLEAAIESGDVRDAASGERWIADAIECGVARLDAPLVAAAHDAWRAWGDDDEDDDDAPSPRRDDEDEGDDDADEDDEDDDALQVLRTLGDLATAARETAELRLESAQTGHSMVAWIERTLDPEPRMRRALARLAPMPLPVAWAAAGHLLGLGRRDIVVGWLWGFAENQAAALMKALPLGQTPAQRLLLALGPRIERAAEAALALADRGVTDGFADTFSGALPGLAIASMRHETQYSRLFRS